MSVLTERKDLLEDAVSEAILDMKLVLAIEEGDTGEYVPEAININIFYNSHIEY